MGVCLSCHGRKRRGSEKKKSDLQLCQSLAPLHECVGDCDKVVSDQTSASAPGDTGDKNPIHWASVASPQAASARAARALSIDFPSEACNGTRKRTVPSYKENLETFNNFYSHDNSNGKQAISLLNRPHLVSISNKKDNSCNSRCDSFSTDLIHVKPCGGDSATMANTISNMKMTNPIKVLVSKQRIRYTEDGFNLDLTCILFTVTNISIPIPHLSNAYLTAFCVRCCFPFHLIFYINSIQEALRRVFPPR